MDRLFGKAEFAFVREDNFMEQMELRVENDTLIISCFDDVHDWDLDIAVFCCYKLDRENTEKFLQSLRSEQNADVLIENLIFSIFHYECETHDLIKHLKDPDICFDQSYYYDRL